MKGLFFQDGIQAREMNTLEFIHQNCESCPLSLLSTQENNVDGIDGSSSIKCRALSAMASGKIFDAFDLKAQLEEKGEVPQCHTMKAITSLQEELRKRFKSKMNTAAKKIIMEVGGI